MKTQLQVIFFCIPALLLSCTKNLTEDTGGDTYTIKVKEYKTNTPLAGVSIKLYKCGYYDPEFGCQSTVLFATHVTDENGEYTITEGERNSANEGITLSKYQYWDIGGIVGENSMHPEAWVKLNLTAGSTYPDSAFLELRSGGESGLGSVLSFDAPKDSTVRVRLVGNEANSIIWVVYPAPPPPCQFYCPKDTLATGTLSLSPKKFESLTSSITY